MCMRHPTLKASKVTPGAEFVSFWPAKIVTEPADGPTLYVRWQGHGEFYAPPPKPLSLLLYKQLYPSLPNENFAGQKLTNGLYL